MLISICKQGYINRILEEIRHTRSHELEVTDICLSIMQYLQKKRGITKSITLIIAACVTLSVTMRVPVMLLELVENACFRLLL